MKSYREKMIVKVYAHSILVHCMQLKNWREWSWEEIMKMGLDNKIFKEARALTQWALIHQHLRRLIDKKVDQNYELPSNFFHLPHHKETTAIA